MARRALDIGFLPVVRRDRHVSEGRRPCGRRRGWCPRDRLLVETDSPYLAPVPFRGKRNEPAHVGRVLESLAALRGDTRAGSTEQTRDNFERLFALGSEANSRLGNGLAR